MLGMMIGEAIELDREDQARRGWEGGGSWDSFQQPQRAAASMSLNGEGGGQQQRQVGNGWGGSNGNLMEEGGQGQGGGFMSNTEQMVRQAFR